MSGVEAVGLVLGVLPLFISAWEHYDEGLRPLKAMIHWNEDLLTQIAALETAQCEYENNIESLIMPVTTEEERDTLATRSFDKLWKDPDIHLRVIRRLDRSCGPFMSQMQRFEAKCYEIARHLDLQQDMDVRKLSQGSLEAVLEQYKNGKKIDPSFQVRWKRRVRFGWSKRRIVALMTELDSCNALLGRLVDAAARLEPYRTTANSSDFRHLQQVRERAGRLNQALAKACSCSIHASHLTCIQLEPRLGSFANKKTTRMMSEGDSIDCIGFHFAFEPRYDAFEGSPSGGKLHELEIAASCGSRQYLRAATEEASTNKIAGRVLHCDDAAVDIGELASVESVCAVLMPMSIPHQLGLFFDTASASLHGCFRGSPRPSSHLEGTTEVVVLGELLPLRREDGRTKGLSQKQRAVLAVTLASSVLQLHSTGFSNQWSKRGIYFLRGSPSQRGCSIAADRPLLVQLPGGSTGLSRPQETPSDALEYSQSVMLSLAVLLLELHSGTSFEMFAARHYRDWDIGTPASPASDWFTLAICKDWLGTALDEMMLGWSSAINFCIISYLDRKADLGDVAYRKEMHEQVVVPLQEHAEAFIGSFAGSQ